MTSAFGDKTDARDSERELFVRNDGVTSSRLSHASVVQDQTGIRAPLSVLRSRCLRSRDESDPAS
jgi:hypothetical protein